jgi:hypothetical protein
MGLRIKNAKNGDTPLTIVHRQLTEFGNGAPEDKAHVANSVLGTKVEKIEDLDEEQLAELSQKIAQVMYS